DTLGLRDLRLEDGEVPGEFYVSCVLPASGPVAARRFEAEAASPAAAAADVLKQVEQWLTR
ncbi:MAG TPA: hypothetical protein VF170_16500, partial [Planctomycetaceae bacterium]